MTKVNLLFNPDYSVSPGSVLGERLAVQEISVAEFAERCDLSPKLVGEVISGKAPLEPKVALQFEKVLGVSACIWLGIEADFRQKVALDAEARTTPSQERWARLFPVDELVSRGIFERPKNNSTALSSLLGFFGVGSVGAWCAKYSKQSVAYRHSAAFKCDIPTQSIWLRLGELEAELQECAKYNSSTFRSALSQIKSVTMEPFEIAWQNAVNRCNEAGVALVSVKPLPQTEFSGSAWWHSPRKAVIQLSFPHKPEGQIWFSLFHEAAHILLHYKKHNRLKSVFVDGENCDEDPLEIEANEWAAAQLASVEIDATSAK